MKLDREGGRPVEMSVNKIDINGFIGKQEWGSSKFLAPCIFYAYTDLMKDQENGSASSAGAEKVKVNMFHYAQLTVEFCSLFSSYSMLFGLSFIHIHFGWCRSWSNKEQL